MTEYICYNGEFLPAETAIVTLRNRSFLYGDGLFESIRLINNRILFLDQHLKRLQEGMKLLSLKSTPDFNSVNLTEKISQLANKNGLNGYGRIRLNIFRNEGGLYAPVDDGINYTISAASSEGIGYKLNSTGLLLDIYKEVKKPINLFSSLKTCNSLLFVLAGIWKNKNNFDDCIILNESGRICEGLSSNIFLIKNNSIVTPPVSEGCINGVMRNKIIELVQKTGYKLSEEDIVESQLFESDEIFLTNASSGVRWVGAFRNKRFFSRHSREIINLLIKHIENLPDLKN